MNYVTQAKRYKRLLNQLRRDTRKAKEGITEDEVIFRLNSLEGLIVLLGNDATVLVMNWESEQRYKEEQERESTTD